MTPTNAPEPPFFYWDEVGHEVFGPREGGAAALLVRCDSKAEAERIVAVLNAWAAALATPPLPAPIQTQDSGHQAERLIPDAHRDGEASS